MPLQPRSHSHSPFPVSPSWQRPFLHSHSADETSASGQLKLKQSNSCFSPISRINLDRSEFHICRSGRFRRPSHWSLCDTDRLQNRRSCPDTPRYRSRAAPSDRDTAHSAPQRTRHSSAAPENTKERWSLASLLEQLYFLAAAETYNVFLEAAGSATDDHHAFPFESSCKHTFPHPHCFLHRTQLISTHSKKTNSISVTLYLTLYHLRLSSIVWNLVPITEKSNMSSMSSVHEVVLGVGKLVFLQKVSLVLTNALRPTKEAAL